MRKINDCFKPELYRGAGNNYNDWMDLKREKIAINLNNEKNKNGIWDRNSRLIVENIERIYNYIFIRKPLFLDGEVHKFDPDYFMAHSG